MDIKRVSIVLLAILCGCVSTRRLEKHLTERATSLSYLHDTEKIPDSKRTSQRLIVEVSASRPHLPPIGHVQVTSNSLVPLLIFNQWNKAFIYRLGDKEVSEEVTAFVRKSAIEEINRSTSLVADSLTATPDDLKLVIEIEKLEATGPYKVEGFILYALIFYLYYEKQQAGPGYAYSKFTCTLSRGRNVLFTDTFESRKEFEPIVTSNTTYKKFRGAFTTNLTELLSITLKENIEAAIRETQRQQAKSRMNR